MMTSTLPRIDEKSVLKTPVGTAWWPWLLTPDTEHDPAGIYHIWLNLPPETESTFLASIRDLYERAIEQKRIEKSVTEIKRGEPPWTKSKDDKLTFVKFKLKASGVFNGDPWENEPPKIFDARAKLIKPNPKTFKLGTGSQVRVYYRPKPYFVKDAGVSLRLVAVQVLKYVEYDPAAALGVEAEEGFVYDEPEDDVEKQLQMPAPTARADIGADDLPF